MSDNIYTGCVFHFNRIFEYDISGSETKGVLLSHPFYFLQNGEKELINTDITEIKPDTIDSIQAAKALLLLHSFPFDYNNSKIKSFFNSKKSQNSGFEIVPYGILALMGGLLYRKWFYKEYKKDIVNTGTVYKSPSIDETFLVNGKKGIGFGIIKQNSKKKYESISKLIQNELDINIQNKLIELFKSFVNETKSELDNIEIKLKYVTDNGKNEIQSFSYETFNKMIAVLPKEENKITELNRILLGKTTFKLNNVDVYVHNFGEKFAIGIINKNKLLFYYHEDDLELQSLFDKLYNHKSGVLTRVCQNEVNREGVMPISTYKNVINGFTSTINYLISRYEKETKNKTISDLKTSRNKADDDIKKAIYLYLKQFWDKWLCGEYNREQNSNKHQNEDTPRVFTAAWFEQHFVFIDSFYNDISDTYKLNCNQLVDFYDTMLTTNTQENGGTSVEGHLATVVQKHGCNFLCYPDFINFANKSSEKYYDEMYEIMEDMFTPMPYNKLNDVQAQNQFIIIKTNTAQLNGNSKEFNDDGFDIWSSEQETDIAPITFKNEIKDFYDVIPTNKMGYKVPAFGVAYSRQNNSIFKSVDVGMDTIQVTDQSLKSLCYISSQLGNKNKRTISFYGNDIYSVYSAYSYIVTVTMLGDFQIQPLMYFQLMNIPMFRGTYLIIEVKHNMRAGDCTTTFKGVKLSRCEFPITSSWFNVPDVDSKAQETIEDDCVVEEVNADGTPVNNK